jgi:hypothetical protein
MMHGQRNIKLRTAYTKVQVMGIVRTLHAHISSA